MSLKLSLLTGFFLFFYTCFSQNHYDKDLLHSDFFKLRRAAFRNEMPENSVAFFLSAPSRNRSNDVDYIYHQDPNFYYLSGFEETEALMIITKSPIELNGVKNDEFLFVKDRNPKKEMWTGKLAGKEGAIEISGISSVFLNTDLKSLDLQLPTFQKILFLNGDNGSISSTDEKSIHNIFREKVASSKEKTDAVLLSKIILKLRQHKQTEELVLLKKAIKISCESINQMLKSVKPDMKEFQVQAMVEYGFKMRGSEYVGYPSIVGSGENSCTLHYETNRKAFEPTDMLVCDAGAEYHGYTADVTRSFPVNGKFSPEQLLIYQLVQKAQAEAIAQCKKGNSFFAPNQTATEVIKKGLVELGIITEEADYKKYFPHGTSHYLGLDVHDIGGYGNLEPGDVLTVEPGIYIPQGSLCDQKWWNIGVRIEDDILITETGYENLSESAVKEPQEIEKTMQKLPFCPEIH